MEIAIHKVTETAKENSTWDIIDTEFLCELEMEDAVSTASVQMALRDTETVCAKLIDSCVVKELAEDVFVLLRYVDDKPIILITA